jgi:hypothetical protein
MLEDYENFKKIQSECSDVFLIDENFCVGNSYEIINQNIINLSSRLISFNSYIDYFNNLFTHFSENSSKYLEVNNNLEKFIDVFDNTYTVVSQTSANWTRPIAFYYPQQFEVNYWNSNKATIQNSIVQNWLNINHPTDNFTKNQILYVYINLYEKRPFRLDKFFRKEYDENCSIIPQTFILNCGGRPCNDLQHGCNVGKKNQKECFNAYSRCGVSVSGGGAVTVTCPTTGAKKLVVTDVRNAIDRFLCTSIGFKYIINNNVWIYDSEV